jgi:hypothetical protein
VSNRAGSVPEDRRATLGFRVVQAQLPESEPLPTPEPAIVFRNVTQKKKAWSQPADPTQPHFEDGTEFITEPADPMRLPYWGRRHVPSITWCENGDLLVTEFTAPSDSSDQMVILISRLREGERRWDPAERFFVAPDRNISSSYLFNAGNGEIHHYNGLSEGRSADFTMLKRVSDDNGANWSVPRIVHEYPATPASFDPLTGEPRLWPHMEIVVLEDGTLVMPSDTGGGVDGGTVLFESTDQGESWSERTNFGWNYGGFAKAGQRAGWIAGIHAPFVVLEDGRYLAIGRTNNIDGHSPLSVSSDGGRTWTYRSSPFPPIFSGQRSVLRRLQEGPLMFISFPGKPDREAEPVPITIADEAGRKHELLGMFSALSYDEGATWERIKLVPQHEGEAYAAELWGYLACVQTPDREIHLVSSRLYYRFNLAWLELPMPARRV